MGEMARQEDWYRHTDLPLFGLPGSYLGPRMLGDADRAYESEGREPSRVLTGESYGLLHGDPLSPGSSTLQAITSRKSLPVPADLLSAEALRPSSPIDLREPRPFTANVSLDGEEVAFDGLRVSDGWVLQASFDGHAVTVVAVRFPSDDLLLTRIRNVEPYISDRRAYLRSKFPA
jgi:hypothetical protein